MMRDSKNFSHGSASIDWGRIKEIFSVAAELEGPAQREYLEECCGSDGDLRSRVEGLLRAHSRTDGFLSEDATPRSPTAESAAPSAIEDSPKRIGAYELHEQLGRGGFGVVYRATQHSPIERDVAVKLIRPGFDSPDLIARFSAERRLLAKMDHADIVKVFDAGATPDGRLFVVMELVRGEPIVNYCESRRMPLKPCVELFARVCRAVHHAHQRAVIHRDLKPSNILVSDEDGVPRPRIIDFGIARVMTDDEASNEQTRQGHILGTPKYISPEQAGAGTVVDIRTDIYSLGVLLCEMLSGGVPRDPKTMGNRPPRETPAELPSRLAARSAQDAADTGRRELLARRLRGDLDRIVLKCVAWEPSHRYESAAALADDLERYLRGEPVRAVAPSRAYLLARFVKRNQWSVGLGTLAILSLVIGLAAALIGFRRAVEEREIAERSRKEADRQTQRAEFVTSFLMEDMLGAVDPEISQGREVTVKELLDLAAAKVEDRFIGDPELRLSIMSRLGRAHMKLAYSKEAKELIAKAQALSEELHGPDDVESIALRIELADLRMNGPDHRAATQMRIENRDRAVAALGAEHPVTLRARIEAISMLPSPTAFITEMESILEGYQRNGLADSPEYIAALRGLATGYRSTGRFEEELPLRRNALKLAEALFGEKHPETIRARNLFGVALLYAGRATEACKAIEEAHREAVEVFGEAHLTTTYIGYDLLSSLIEVGRNDDAIEAARSLLETQIEQHGDIAIQTTAARHFFAVTLLSAGHAEEALPILERTYEEKRSQWGDRHAITLKVLSDLVQALRKTNQLVGAVAFVDEALKEQLPIALARGPIQLEFGRTLEAAGRYDEAARLLQDAYDDIRTTHGDKHPLTVEAKTALDEFNSRHRTASADVPVP